MSKPFSNAGFAAPPPPTRPRPSTARYPWRRAGAGLLILGVTMLFIAGAFWLGGEAAASSAARYQTAPVCGPATPTPGVSCRTILTATVVSWGSSGEGRSVSHTVTVRLPAGSTRSMVVAGGDLFAALQTDLPVQAEAWAGHIIRLTDNADHELTTVDNPQQLAYDEPVSGGLLGGLGAVLVVLGGFMWRARR